MRYVVEHKTASGDIAPGSDYWKRLRLDSQVSTYIAGVKQLLSDDRVDGVLYDVIGKPTIKPAKATPLEARKYTKPTKSDPTPRLYANQREHDETVEEYRARLEQDIAANPDDYYRRGIVVRTEAEEKEAALDVWGRALQLRRSQLQNRDLGGGHGFPRNTDACMRWGSKCEFWGVCSGEASLDDETKFRRATKPHEELPETSTEHRRLPMVSNSSLKSYATCPRLYLYRYEQGYRSLETSDALRFGTLMHLGLEAWFRTASLDAAIEAMQGEADPFERAKAECLMIGYHARYIDEPIDVIAVEQEFVGDLVNPLTGAKSQTFRIAGKIDALVEVRTEVKEEAAE